MLGDDDAQMVYTMLERIGAVDPRDVIVTLQNWEGDWLASWSKCGTNISGSFKGRDIIWVIMNLYDQLKAIGLTDKLVP